MHHLNLSVIRRCLAVVPFSLQLLNRIRGESMKTAVKVIISTIMVLASLNAFASHLIKYLLKPNFCHLDEFFFLKKYSFKKFSKALESHLINYCSFCFIFVKISI